MENSDDETIDDNDHDEYNSEEEEGSLLSEMSNSFVMVEKKHDDQMILSSSQQTNSSPNNDDMTTKENKEKKMETTKNHPSDSKLHPSINIDNNNKTELKQHEIDSTIVEMKSKEKRSVYSYLEKKLPCKIQDGIRPIILFVEEQKWNNTKLIKYLLFGVIIMLMVGIPYRAYTINESRHRRQVTELETQIRLLQQELGTMHIWRKKAKKFQEEIVSLKNELYTYHRKPRNCPPQPDNDHTFSFENSWFKANADIALGEDGKEMKEKALKYIASMKESMDDYVRKTSKKTKETKEIDYTGHIIDPFNAILEGLVQSFN